MSHQTDISEIILPRIIGPANHVDFIVYFNYVFCRYVEIFKATPGDLRQIDRGGRDRRSGPYDRMGGGYGGGYGRSSYRGKSGHEDFVSAL